MPAPREGHWRGRPWLAALVRLFVVGVPVLAGWSAARCLAPATAGAGTAWLRVGLPLATALTVSLLVSRVTSRFLPLAVLLRMTMVFPDQAPSRMKLARRTTSLADIRSRLGSVRLDEHEAATTMLSLVTALGRHDRHTRGHSERVRLFCDLLAKELGLSNADAGRLRWAALVHDIGKLEVPTVVLNKPGKLNTREWDMIRCHPYAGAQLAAPLKEWLGPWFAGIAEHHEKYDGSGYPAGLAGTAISTAGRAIAVVDAFETMTAARSYKSARSTLSARAELTACAGSHFDPVMVRAFLAISLPRLLWSIGPLAFLVNLPYLRAVGESGLRLGTAVGTTTAGAANVASAAAVAVAVAAAPTAATPAVATPTMPVAPATARAAGPEPSSQPHAAPQRASAPNQPSARPTHQPKKKPPRSGQPHPKPVPKPKAKAKAKATPKAVPKAKSVPKTKAKARGTGPVMGHHQPGA
jgi:response regulator RpfG family c-di-GMP phosphodiesterase